MFRAGPALLLSAFLWVLPVAGASPGSAARPSDAVGGAASAVESVAMVVGDIDRSVAFLSEVLSFEKVSDTEVTGDHYDRLLGVFGVRLRVARMRLGDEFLDLLQFLSPEGRVVPADSRSNDLWFQHVAIVVSDMRRAYAHLRTHNVRHASVGPQRLPDWNAAAGGIEAFYFRDPDGHTLEIISFPPGKGAAKWHRRHDRLFLGLDHTAIAVSDTSRSLRFYADGLGLQIAGASENHGIEQERLNNVFGARLRITAVRAAEGPAIEFLEYLAPGDGRPLPTDAKANDRIAWQTRLAVPDLGRTTRRLLPGTFAFVSPGAVMLRDAPAAFSQAALVRDPDGHLMLLGER